MLRQVEQVIINVIYQILVGAEGFAYFSCFLKRYALISLEPMPNMSCSVSI
jgi:hypothetical protein